LFSEQGEGMPYCTTIGETMATLRRMFPVLAVLVCLFIPNCADAQRAANLGGDFQIKVESELTDFAAKHSGGPVSLEMKNGRKLEGRIRELRPTSVTIEAPPGHTEIVVDYSEIARIHPTRVGWAGFGETAGGTLLLVLANLALLPATMIESLMGINC